MNEVRSTRGTSAAGAEKTEIAQHRNAKAMATNIIEGGICLPEMWKAMSECAAADFSHGWDTDETRIEKNLTNEAWMRQVVGFRLSRVCSKAVGSQARL